MIESLAPRLVPVVLANLRTHYPYHDSHFMTSEEDVHDPMRAHPAFGNSFDWHSSVHSHWTALNILDYFAESEALAPAALADLRGVVEEHLTEEHLSRELEYLEAHPSFERPYGWGWAMLLATVAPQSYPLAEWVAKRAIAWIRALPLPVRHGVHSNTAFSLGLMHDAACALRFEQLRETIEDRSRAWFNGDRAWPQPFERSGNDFISPGASEADLMRRVLSPDEFARWWDGFFPAAAADDPIFTAAEVPNVADGHIVHLHGLNLSRAAQFARVGLARKDRALLRIARSLYDASVDRAVGGHYTETHWLPTFAWDAAASIDAAESAFRES